jgi:glycerophosphoryl diester phosphodiesterase
MASLRLAVDAGVDYVELDVHLSRDGVLVVIHDEGLERTTDGRGLVVDTMASQLQALDAGSWYAPRFAGESVPLLSGLMAELVDARTPAGTPVGAIVEAKGEGTGAPLAQTLAGSPIRDRLAICSFSAAELRAAREAAPDLATMLIVDRDRPDADPIALARECGANLVNVPAAWLSGDDVERLHGAGLLVAGGSGDDEATVGRAIAIGLDAIDSNVPDLAVGWRAAAGASASPVATGSPAST